MTEDKMGSGRTVASGEGTVGNEGVLEAVAAQARKMFCFQCEQTAGCGGCTSAGVCGKSALTAREQDGSPARSLASPARSATRRPPGACPTSCSTACSPA